MKVFFIYIGVVGGFSGQAAATELIIDGFRREGIAVSCGWVPHLNRIGKAPKLLRFGFFLCRLLRTYWKFVWVRLPADGAIHLSLGLTSFALFRDGFAMCCAGLLNAKSVRKVVALNGSVFAEWSIASLNARLFRAVIRGADTVTCVGTSHRQALIDLGVPETKIEVVPNVCEYDGIEASAVQLKQHSAQAPIELLFLSSLTDTKGYPEYLEALELISQTPGSPIHAVLCGPITAGAYRRRFQTVVEAKTWIEAMIARINLSGRIYAEWIPGASGAAKAALYKKAQIFVLPTCYPVEAQPLVVLEAMAHGCAIVTTDIGELPATVNTQQAVILTDPSTENVRQAMMALIEDPDRRLELALNGLRRFRSDFNREVYHRRWQEILQVSGASNL